VRLRELRAPFFVASIIPVVVGSAAGYAAKCSESFRGSGGPATAKPSGEAGFDWTLGVLALVGTVLLHGAANVANDYFDHVSGNDASNHNLTPFSGGSRVIQEGLMTPAQVLAEACVLWGAGAAVGTALAIMGPAKMGPGPLTPSGVPDPCFARPCFVLV